MNTWLVNTNTAKENCNPNGFKYMIRQNRAIAWGGAGSQLNGVQPNDLILLYHNDNRIVAVGIAVSSVQQSDFPQKEDYEEYWIDSHWLWVADFDENSQPINPINRKSVGIYNVRNTVNQITDEINYQALLAQIAEKTAKNLQHFNVVQSQ